jgi:hypothetical protein
MPGPNRHWILSALLTVVAVAVIHRMLPPRVDPVLRLEISKNRSAVGTLYQTRDIGLRKDVMVDVLDLSRNGRFEHPKLGDIGYGQDFFVDIEKTFQVRRAGDYRFVVASDDGFAIHINGKELCSFHKDRSMATQSCGVSFEEGQQTFRLSYFQAGGPAGLKVQYARQGDRTMYWFGESSPYFSFAP